MISGLMIRQPFSINSEIMVDIDDNGFTNRNQNLEM